MRAWWIAPLAVALVVCARPTPADGYCVNIPQGLTKEVTWKTIPVTYRVSDNLTDAAMLKAIDDAFKTWQDVKCSTMKFTKGAQFKICTDKANCPSGSVHFDAMSNGYIYIFWFDSTNQASFPTANTSAYYSFVNYDLPDQIKGGGLAVNAFKYQWNATGGDPTAPGTLDVQNEMTTMAGAMIGLTDSTVTTASMYPQMKFGDTSKRALDQDDIDGISHLYFNAADTTCTKPTPPGASGCTGSAPVGDGGTTPTGDGGTTPTGDGSAIYTEAGIIYPDGGGTGSGDDDDGCGCRFAAAPELPVPAALLVGLVLGLLVLRRRKRVCGKARRGDTNI